MWRDDPDLPSNLRRAHGRDGERRAEGYAQLLLASAHDEHFVLDFVAVDELAWLGVPALHPFTLTVSIPPILQREIVVLAMWTASLAVVCLSPLTVASEAASWLVLEDADAMLLLRFTSH